MRQVVVLGAGAAGLFCAAKAAAGGAHVRVLERTNKPGKKILMSGGGRCNFTNRIVEARHFLSANPHFCKSALARYKPADFIARVDARGIRWHEKELGQLFCDESSKDILAMLLDDCAARGVRIDLDCEVETVAAVDGGYALKTSIGDIHTEALVVATGGLSIPSLGGSGFGYEIARQFGHEIVPTRAGLVPLTLSGQPLEDWNVLSGVSLPVSARAGKAEFRNAMLVTHRGLSGPALLQISNYWQPGEKLEIDLMPGTDALAFLAQKKETQPESELRTVLSEAWPKRFAQRFCELLAPSQPMKRYTPAQLKAIAGAISNWPVTPSGTEGYRTAEVTLGGVDTREISSTTFESKRAPGLYFIGEVLDVTGWLGGYNFQWAWASAHACGEAICQPLAASQ